MIEGSLLVFLLTFVLCDFTPYCRMHALCMDILGEVGEETIYAHYLKGDMDTRVCMMDYNVCVKQLSKQKPKVAKPKKEEL